MTPKILKSFLSLQLFMIITLSPAFALDYTCFRHKTDGRLKLDCFRSKGKHDAFPVLKCKDEDGEDREFDPGMEWEEVEIVPVCFEYTGEGPAIGKKAVKGRCVKISGKKEASPIFSCLENRQ